MTSTLDTYAGKLIVGIDLGTTKSGLAVYREASDQVEMVEDGYGRTILPSVVGWDREHERWLVGGEAKRFASKHPDAVVRSIKRYIGRWYIDDAVRKMQPERAFKLEPGTGQDQLEDIFVNFGFDHTGRSVRLSAPEVSGKVLSALRTIAATHLGLDEETIKYAVITIPAYFNDLQRNATIRAGNKAGLEVVDIINEPTASALAYRNLVLEMGETRRIMVYDLGGGTFDISILLATLDEHGFSFDTEVVDGDTRLGGDDIDQKVVQWLIDEVEKQSEQKVRSDDLVSRERLRQAAETAKIELTDHLSTTVQLDNLSLGAGDPFDFAVELTRAQLDECAGEVISRVRAICRRAVEQLLRKSWDEIDAIVLVGGQTQMPAIQQDIEAFSNKKPLVIPRPQEAIALGAGEYAHTLSLGGSRFHERSLQHVVALPVGIYIPRPVPIFQPLIAANSGPLPVSGKHVVKTTENDQDHIDIEILQGKQWDATKREQCDLIGVIRVSDLLPAPAGMMVFEITVTAEDNGTLSVMVVDRNGIVKPERLQITEKRVTVYRAGAENPT